MKKRLIIACLIAISSLGLTAQVQFAAGLGASLTYLSPSIEVAGKINDQITLRAGIGGINFKKQHEKDIRVDAIYKELGYHPVADMNIKCSTWHGSLLVDYSPFESFSIFSFTGGFIIGSPAANFDIVLRNPKTGKAVVEELSSEDHAIITSPVDVEIDGKSYSVHLRPDAGADLKAKLSSTFRPYLGIGLGRAVAASRLGWKLDLGVCFGSGINASNPQLIKGDPMDIIENAISEKDMNWYNTLDKAARFWPQLKFSLFYRIN